MDANVAEFLAAAGQFQLGGLDTERPHPMTVRLSALAQQNAPEAIDALKNVDLLALERFSEKAAGLIPLAVSIGETLAAGRRIFLCGCGATGRLSLSLELFCREGLLPPEHRDQVAAFMAGGDLALIRAVAKFEDHPEYGARQLEEMGFSSGDLLIASTEGGETPWVIGAAERAAQLSGNRPWFLYCNPDAVLISVTERSRRVLANPDIRKLNLAVGPMAISGSTRMQACTVLLAAIGFALQHHRQPELAAREPEKFRSLVAATDFRFLAPFVELESATYRNGGHVLYEPGRYGITVLTDNTERSPTFSLRPFENQNRPEDPASWCHLHLDGQPDALAAWRMLLRREPRTLEWDGVRETAGAAALAGYDFSDALLEKRRLRTGGAAHLRFRIGDCADALVFDFAPLRHAVALGAAPDLIRHLMLKLLLNTHSTLVMGRLGRYLDNLMTHVNPTNLKLIDRAIRYVRLLVERRTGTVPDYEAVAGQLFLDRDRLQPDEPIVMKTMAAFLPPPQ